MWCEVDVNKMLYLSSYDKSVTNVGDISLPHANSLPTCPITWQIPTWKGYGHHIQRPSSGSWWTWDFKLVIFWSVVKHLNHTSHIQVTWSHHLNASFILHMLQGSVKVLYTSFTLHEIIYTHNSLPSLLSKCGRV